MDFEELEKWALKKGYERVPRQYMKAWVLDNKRGLRVSLLLKGERVLVAVYRHLAIKQSQERAEVFGMQDEWVTEIRGLEGTIRALKHDADKQFKERKKQWKPKPRAGATARALRRPSV